MNKIVFLFIFLPFTLLAQKPLQGTITDSTNGKPLPFASVITNFKLVTLSDVEGKFQLHKMSF